KLSSHPQHEQEAFAQCRVRAARVKLALALYQAEAGKPAPTLAHLVPRYLEDLPLDPFSGQPFHYRVSTGQRIVWRGGGSTAAGGQPEWTDVPAGQGILWSVGPESSGTFGMRGTPFLDPLGQEHFLVARDQVFLVPSWPR